MASPTRWTWVWVNSRSWWWTGRPGALRFMGSQRVGHDWATELNWTELKYNMPPHLWSLRLPVKYNGKVRIHIRVNRKHTFINQQWAAFEGSNLIKSATQTITGCRKPIHSWISCLPAWEPLLACTYLGDLQLDTNAISRSHQGPELNRILRVGAPHHSLSSGLSAPSLGGGAAGWGGGGGSWGACFGWTPYLLPCLPFHLVNVVSCLATT